MKKFLKILAVSLITLNIIGCGSLRKICHKNNSGVEQVENYGVTMKIVFDRQFNLHQFDSLCVADTLPVLLTKWRKITIDDYETDRTLEEYLYIKRLGKNESTYRLIKENEELYNINKRVVYETREEE